MSDSAITAKLYSLALSLHARYKQSKLLKSGIWYSLAILGQRGIGFVSVFLFIRLLTTEAYGTVAIAASWASILAATITLNVHGATSRAKYDYSEPEFRRFVSAVTFLGTVSS